MVELNNYIKDNQAFVLIDDEITSYYASMITAQIYEYNQKGYDVTVKINTIGGSVYAGMSIIDAIIETKSNTQAIGLAASMGLMILQAGKKRTALDIAVGMGHAVQGGDDDDFTKLTSDSLKKILRDNAKLSDDVINTIMSPENGETFMSADKMLEMGLIDEIVSTGRKVEVSNKSLNEAYAIYNKLNLTEVKMDNTKIKNVLELADNASEERVFEAVTNIKNELKTANELLDQEQSEKEALKAEKVELENKLKAIKEANVNSLINEYTDIGVINDQNKEQFTELANTNLELAKNTLKQLANKGELDVHGLMNQKGEPTTLKNMTQEEKEKLAREKPEVYNKLILNEK